MSDTMRQRDDGSWERALPIPESFGVTWERCWRSRYRNGHGQGRVRSLLFGFMDARALRRLTEARDDS